jgi:hypothetical protein
MTGDWTAWAAEQDEPTREAVRTLWRGLGPLTLVLPYPTPLCVGCGRLNDRRYGLEGGPVCPDCKGES